MTETLELKAPFSGELYHEYTFRVQARDLVGHVSDWITTTVAIVNQTKYYFLDGRRVAMRKGDKVYYLYGDHLGSTTLATNESGEVVYKGHYLPYGGGRLNDGISPTDFGFTDQRNEVGLGLMDYSARYYDPYLNQFISADPIVPESGNPQALNRYSYVYNNPIKYTDPSGHCPGCGSDSSPVMLIERPEDNALTANISTAYYGPPEPKIRLRKNTGRFGNIELAVYTRRRWTYLVSA